MGYSRSNNLKSSYRSSFPELKKNTKLQAVLLALVTVVLILYGFLLSYQLSAVLYAVNLNTELVQSDTKLEEVEEFEVKDDSAIIKLFNGDTVNRANIDFAFYENTDSDEVFYSAEDNMLLMELADDYATTFLNGNSYFIVLIATAAFLIFLFIIRRKGWTVYSTRVARVLWSAVFVGLVFVGGCFYIVL